MNKADRAEELFRKGYNCSQSVFVAFAEELGMSEEEAARMASPSVRVSASSEEVWEPSPE